MGVHKSLRLVGSINLKYLEDREIEGCLDLALSPAPEQVTLIASSLVYEKRNRVNNL